MTNQLPVKRCQHCGGEDIRVGWQSDALVTFKRNGLLGNRIKFLICGNCGAVLAGDCGTSRQGVKHFYYSCAKRKKSRSCIKKSEKKDFLEWYVCEQTALHVLTEKRIKEIAKEVSALHEQDSGRAEIKKLEQRLKDIDRELDAAADALIRTSSPVMINKINEKAALLEAQQAEAELELSKLQVKQDFKLTAADVEKYLQSFTQGDLLDEEFRRRMINALINAVYVYDDKVVIYYNLRGAKLVTHIEMIADLDQLAEPAECSDSITDGPPTQNANRKAVGVLCCCSTRTRTHV